MLSRLAFILIFNLCAVAQLQAQDDWQSWPTGDRFTFGVEAFYINTDSDLTIGLVDIGEIEFDLEDALGLDDSETIFTVEASWRFAKRHSLAYRYFGLDRSSRTLFEDEDDALINPYLDIELQNHDVSYSYSFIFDERRDFYGGIGLSLMSFEFAIKDDEEVLPDYDYDSSPPVPTFLLGYNWAFSPKWAWRNQVNLLAVGLALDDDVDVEGNIMQFNTRIEWRVLEHLSLTASYEYADLDLETKDGLIKLGYQDTFKGPRIGATLRF